MPISVSCPGCHANFKAPDQLAGRGASCPKCQTKLQIPALAAGTVLPIATALPGTAPGKPPLPQARPANATPAAPAVTPPPNVSSEQQLAKESILKKKWSVDKIIINVVAVIVFIWVIKELVVPLLNRDISHTQRPAGSR
jgi:hypothetical protein